MSIFSVLRSLCLWAAVGMLSACATVALPKGPPLELLRDDLFKPSSSPISAEAVFALSPAMRDYVDHEIAYRIRSRGAREALLDSLYTKGQLQLDYDSEVTRTAAQAFKQRRGNCLSLVIMTAAFAKHLNLPVRFHSVFVDEFWSRRGDMYFQTGHVNMALAARRSEINATSLQELEMMTVDFLPGVDLRGQRRRVIEEHTVIAMFMNNRAAESLAQGAVDDAYWWVRASLQADPRMLSAYNTLGVVYRRRGELDLAKASFQAVLSLEPENVQAMSNLVLVLEASGQSQAAASLSARLRDLQPYPPYKFFDEGVLAMQRGDYQQAKALFERELARSAFFHEFHFWAALANYGLGDVKAAHKHMALALENSSTEREKQLYTAKMDSLRSRKHIFH
jgi:Tfp pilus assembly protein PilF